MENIKFKPLHSGVVVQIELMSSTAKGGIILSEAQMNPFVTVVSVGDGVKADTIKVGKTALLNPGVSPMPILAGNEKAYFLIKEYDLLGIYDKAPTKEMVALALDHKLMQSAISRDNTQFIDKKVVDSLKAKKNNWKNADISEVEPNRPKIVTGTGGEGGMKIM